MFLEAAANIIIMHILLIIQKALIYIPYIGNRSRKKMFADFANLGAFVTIFLALFDVVMKNLNRNNKFANVFLRMLQQLTFHENFLSRTIPNIRYVHTVAANSSFYVQSITQLNNNSFLFTNTNKCIHTSANIFR